MKKKKGPQGSCEQCNNYVYDEDYECYTCEMDLDEDEMARFCQIPIWTVPTISLGMNIWWSESRCNRA